MSILAGGLIIAGLDLFIYGALQFLLLIVTAGMQGNVNALYYYIPISIVLFAIGMLIRKYKNVKTSFGNYLLIAISIFVALYIIWDIYYSYFFHI